MFLGANGYCNDFCMTANKFLKAVEEKTMGFFVGLVNRYGVFKKFEARPHCVKTVLKQRIWNNELKNNGTLVLTGKSNYQIESWPEPIGNFGFDTGFEVKEGCLNGFEGLFICFGIAIIFGSLSIFMYRHEVSHLV